MSAFDVFLWNALGYTAMVMIFVGGFAAVAIVTCFLLERMGRGEAR